MLKFLVYNRFRNLRNVKFVHKKIDSPLEHYTSFPLMKEKYYLVGKLRKHI